MFLTALLFTFFAASAAITPTVEDRKNDSCSIDLKYVCGTPDENTLLALYPGLFKPISRQKLNILSALSKKSAPCGQPDDYYYAQQLRDDGDMCCTKNRELRAPLSVKDVSRTIYTVVHLQDLGLYQFLPYTSLCRQNTCTGKCMEQCTPVSVLVWYNSNGLKVKFATVYLSTHCSCQNVGS